MELMELLTGRRTYRRYLQKEIEPCIIDEILHAARLASSAANKQPLSYVVIRNAQKVEDILNKLHEDGKTMLIATHDVDFAWRFADRILVFCDGNMIADGTPAEIFMQTDVMEQAHLKKPSIMVIWEALIQKGRAADDGNYPATPQQAAQRIADCRNERGELI